ncbi:nitroreductase family protein [Lachnoclostridium phytofermentans]|uniref:Nitroreductase n=1 Tax=Lachnoclostridium phytofermentans (strain ATCC 700394 / DSM 18823 / ISDg) TaxID=357809 RepID=A9KM07_LACP7|nr:nitroreductase family protein [Lachnoclostridium phytofermentans]ABX41350.1 nitroreductase [Lachnoclostridium phytofermentans ISDg]
MMIVNKEKCIACGLCINDCPARCITWKDNKAFVVNKICIECGHCIAICPKFAVSTEEDKMKEVIPYKEETFHIEPENLLNFIKFRRSIRQFKDQEVEIEKLEKIIEAGRFTETARNLQDVSYIVVRKDIDKLRILVMERLYHMGQHILENLTQETMSIKKYAKMWVDMYEAYQKNPNIEDTIYFNAPALILVVSPTPINGGLASTNMELMTNALGLGTFYSGFTVRAAEDNQKIREFLELKEDEQIISCLAIGYPKVNYLRTVPRNDAKITWL